VLGYKNMGGAYHQGSAGRKRNGASSSSGRGGGDAARCELLDWSSYEKAHKGDRQRGEEQQQRRQQGGLYLPGQQRLLLPHESRLSTADTREYTRSTPRMALSRRGLLTATTAASTAAALDLIHPQLSAAFIDLPSRLHNRYFLVRHGESILDTRNIILSNPSFKYDTTYGLTRLGIDQMHKAAVGLSLPLHSRGCQIGYMGRTGCTVIPCFGCKITW
jgi:hypothetical protein